MHHKQSKGVANLLESDHRVPRLDGHHTFPDRLDNACTLMSKDNRERSLGVLPRKCIGVCSIKMVVNRGGILR